MKEARRRGFGAVRQAKGRRKNRFHFFGYMGSMV